jgi:hypothetical protein
MIVLASLAFATSCQDGTPDARSLASISDIHAPDSIGAGDSLVVSFGYRYGGCDNDVVIEVSGTSNVREFGVTFHHDGLSANCPDVIHLRTYRYSLPPSQRLDPFSIRFRQPGGGDVERSVIWR